MLLQNPHLYNPEKGFIATANYYPEVDFGIYHSGFWQPSDRIERINKLLTDKKKLGIDDMKRIFVDDFVEPGKDIQKTLKNILENKNMNNLERNASTYAQKRSIGKNRQ